MLSGIVVFLKPDIHKFNFKWVLIYSGAFLFSSTILHLLPEAFELADSHFASGCLVLLGFYFQMFIEFFSEGVEHGHIHIHKPKQLRSISLIIALSIHALLEGMIISHGDMLHHDHNTHTLLIGLLVHKVPETIALIAVLIINQVSRPKIFVVLLLFAAASPIGVIASDYFHQQYVHFTAYIMALVAGNFLYIATTIFFESNPEHKVQPKRILSLLLGGLTAVALQYFL